MGQPTRDRLNGWLAPLRDIAEATFSSAVRRARSFGTVTSGTSGPHWKPLPDLDPEVLSRIDAMLETMTDVEREEMLRTVGHTVLAFASTKDPDYLVQLARQVHITVTLRNSDEYVKALQNEPQEAAPAAHAVSIGELLSKLG